MASAPIPLSDVTLALLAGGEGSRMGRPKADLCLHGRPILDFLLDRFGWPGPTLLVTAPGRERPPGWERFDREVSDPVSGSGPLRGVMTALESVETPLLVVATVDMPGTTAAQLAWFVEQLSRRGDAPPFSGRPEGGADPADPPTSNSLFGVMGRRITPNGEQIEPFPCAFWRQAKDWVAAQMARGVRSTYRLSQTDRVAAIEVPAEWPALTWANLNRPEDVAAYEEST